MSEQNEAEMKEWAKTLKTEYIWNRLQYILQPMGITTELNSKEPIAVFDDRIKQQLSQLGASQDWVGLLQLIKQFTSSSNSYHGHFRLSQEVDENTWRSYPHDYSRRPTIATPGYKYFGKIEEKGASYNEHALMDELVRRSEES